MKKILFLCSMTIMAALSSKSQDTLSKKNKALKPYYDTTMGKENGSKVKQKSNILDMQKKPLKKWPDSVSKTGIDTLKKPE